jgi:4-hydroxy-tetrahydrodipicolinate synthase
MARPRLELDLPGNLVPPLTPFAEDGSVDWRRLQDEVDSVVTASRPAAVTVAGVEAQEYQCLSGADREELITRTVEFVGGRAPCVVGVSHPSFRTAVALAGQAERVGAAAVQVLIPQRPSGGPASLREVLDYFDAISRETSLPIVAYHNPGPGGEVGPDALIELAGHEAVQAFKESSRNLRHVGQVIEAVEGAGLARYFTTMEVLLPSLELGGSGGTMPPPGSAIAAVLVDHFRAGRLREAAQVQQVFRTFPSRWMRFGGMTAVMKAALAILGPGVGDPFPPFGKLGEAERAELAAFLDRHRSLLDVESVHA